MKTTMMTISGMLLGMAAASAPSLAVAMPGDASVTAGVEILDVPTAPCPQRGRLCFTAALPATVAAASEAVAELGSHAAAAAPPLFARASSLTVPRPTKSPYGDELGAWTVELSGLLRQPALSGNALFLVYDAENAKALAAHEVTAMWQTAIHSGPRVAARLTLSPDDGFRPAHTYRVRVAQIISGREVVLAESDLRLQ
jgi:hypothetical protein